MEVATASIQRMFAGLQTVNELVERSFNQDDWKKKMGQHMCSLHVQRSHVLMAQQGEFMEPAFDLKTFPLDPASLPVYGRGMNRGEKEGGGSHNWKGGKHQLLNGLLLDSSLLSPIRDALQDTCYVSRYD